MTVDIKIIVQTPNTYRIPNIQSINIIEDITQQTQLATIICNNFSLPQDVTDIIGSKTDIFLSYFKNGVSQEKKHRFSGYISSYIIEDSMTTIELEDEMYVLKNKLSGLKQSFPSPIRENIFRHPQEDILTDNSFLNEPLKLHHILYYCSNITGFDKKVYCYDLEIGKTRMNDFLSYSEVIALLSEKFGFHAYMKLDGDVTTKGEYSFIDPVLYVGSKYMYEADGYEIKSLIKDNGISKNYIRKSIKKGKENEEENYPVQTKATKSPNKIKIRNNIPFHKFAYPYTPGYNHILSHDIFVRYTKKDDLYVIVKSLNTLTNVVNIVSLPTDKYAVEETKILNAMADEAAKKDQLIQYIKDYTSAKETSKSYVEKNNIINVKETKLSPIEYEKLKAKAIESKAQLDAIEQEDNALSDYIALNKEHTNYISIDIPDLTLETMNLLAHQAYDNYIPDGSAGSFSTYGEPIVKIGDLVQIKIKDLIECYWVDRVETTFSVDGGYRQNITLGNKYQII